MATGRRSLIAQERVSQLLFLWLAQHPAGKRTANNLMKFYGWLRDNRPELLNRRCADSYHDLKLELRGYIQPE
jgi:hypothetical protein